MNAVAEVRRVVAVGAPVAVGPPLAVGGPEGVVVAAGVTPDAGDAGAPAETADEPLGPTVAPPPPHPANPPSASVDARTLRRTAVGKSSCVDHTSAK